MNRSRTITWEDPIEGAAKARTMAGIDYLQAMTDGEIGMSPLTQTLDIKAVGFEKGQAIFVFEPQEFHYNPIGAVHGGVITSILDSAMGCALHSTLAAGSGYTTLELKVNFLKAVTIKTGKLQAIGRLIHAGRTTALAEAQLIDKDGVVHAHATSTCIIFNK